MITDSRSAQCWISSWLDGMLAVGPEEEADGGAAFPKKLPSEPSRPYRLFTNDRCGSRYATAMASMASGSQRGRSGRAAARTSNCTATM